MIYWPDKDPDEVKDYSWRVPLDDGDSIASFQALGGGSVTIDRQENTESLATVWLSGGVVGEEAVFTLRATTVAGRTFEETARLSIANSDDATNPGARLSLSLAKQHLRIDHDEEDALVAQSLAAALAWVENPTGKLLTRREVAQDESAFGHYLPLFYGPNPANLSIDYTGTDGSAGLVDDARIVRDRAYPVSAWPSMGQNTAVLRTYTAGFTETPADLVSAVLVHLRAQYDEWRTGESDSAAMMAVEALCRPYRSLRV